MKIAIFGWTGETGRQIIEQAMNAGHQISALVRDPVRLSEASKQANIIVGDVLNTQKVHETISGADTITHFDPDKLDQPAGKQTTRNAIEFIHGVAEHRLYHTAQMEFIKTLVKHRDIK